MWSHVFPRSNELKIIATVSAAARKFVERQVCDFHQRRNGPIDALLDVVCVGFYYAVNYVVIIVAI